MYSFIGNSLATFLLFPVEMWVNVLRRLDDTSLLNAFFACKRFMNICKGDPILRRRVRAYIRQRKQLHMKAAVDPNLEMEIIRQGLPQLYGRNQVKTVTIHKLTNRRINNNVVPQVNKFASVLDNRPVGGGKLTKKYKDRPVPYKLIRC